MKERVTGTITQNDGDRHSFRPIVESLEESGAQTDRGLLEEYRLLPTGRLEQRERGRLDQDNLGLGVTSCSYPTHRQILPPRNVFWSYKEVTFGGE